MDLKSSKRGFHRSPGTSTSVVKGNETRLFRCVHCGWVCDTERDNRLQEDSWAGLGINYGTQLKASTSIGDPRNPVIDSYAKLYLKFNSLTDELGKTITNSGVSLSTTSWLYSGSAGSFNGSSYLSLASTNDWAFGSSDFTVRFGVRFSVPSAAQTFVSQYVSNSNAWYIYKNAGSDAIGFTFTTGGSNVGVYIASSPVTLTTTNWFDIQVSRVGTTAKLFINGVSQALTETISFSNSDVGNNGGLLYIGQRGNSAGFVNGLIDEVVISKGTARNTSNFVPSEFSLYNFSGADRYYERNVSSGCPSCGSFIYDHKPDNRGSVS